MPNHVHVVILPKVAAAQILQKIKGVTARTANKALNRTGQPFWSIESYDHVIRCADELNRVIRYIERNPVEAGLVNSIEEWHWGSAWQKAQAEACVTSAAQSPS